MLDEDDAIALLEDLAARHPEAVKPLVGAVLVRPRPDRIAVVGGADVEICAAAQAAGQLPDAQWWFSLTTWGRLEMWGDVEAAGAWVRLAQRW